MIFIELKMMKKIFTNTNLIQAYALF